MWLSHGLSCEGLSPALISFQSHSGFWKEYICQYSIFYMLILSFTQKDLLKISHCGGELICFSFNSVNFCFICFVPSFIHALYVHPKLRVVKTSWWIKYFIIKFPPLSILMIFSLKSTLILVLLNLLYFSECLHRLSFPIFLLSLFLYPNILYISFF